jgi:hypothetical protein
MSRRSTIAAAVLLLIAAPAGLWADLTNARAQPNLERRARLALDNAALQLRLASQADKSGDWAKTKEALAELGESVDLAYLSLKQTGKNPRNSGQFKNLEIKVRGLVKNLEEFRRTLDFEQREELTPLVKHLRQVHDEVLQSVMTPKKR